ncbi:PQQ-dependent sugar dehydrogenase [Oceanitalea stevensii]|uniref:PQQ-dependent sugar dehydrogenase n=1 Tax=Oceanitalea stevensii TaxID=2763072 RepID=A0ABR8Z5F8_9MICO|nr:PQQ-dependent sugar dehydrogenase [Oceanitalea stevensii]MBD8063562.1 PQQ-dependent sugar dehydrogenase [Oceanitalea stevensii]
MNANNSRSRLRRGVAAAVTGFLTVSGLVAAGVPATAHDGVDHAAEPGAEAALDWSNYEKTTLTKDVGEPVDMAILPDGRVIHTARNGAIRLTDPGSGVTRTINNIPVYANSEDGLQGIALDPDFEENGWVYLVYAPVELSGVSPSTGRPYPARTPSGNAPNSLPAGQDVTYWDQWLGYNLLARFQWDDEANALDLSSEEEIIKVEAQRGQCCHVGADIDFDGEGNLYLSTGDNTPASTPGASGYAPNNDAPGMNPGFDARRGAGNTNDLRGKILRIAPLADIDEGVEPGPGTSYTVPEGNLFTGEEYDDVRDKVREEIFVMGARNPFRIEVDPGTNSLSWGDYGPDAGAANPNRGPMGYVEWNVIPLDSPVNAGWPYVHGPNAPYNEWDYATSTPREFFDPENLRNNSRWNNGLVELPPAFAATVYYGDRPGDQPFDELVNFGTSGGQAPMGGPVYHYDAENPSTAKFPEYWDKKNFFGEWAQDYIAALTVDWETFEVTHVEDFMPNRQMTFDDVPWIDNPIDLEFGPDGSLYVLDYGDGYFRANPDAGLYRISYAEGNKSPRPAFTATPISSSEAPLEVQFDASASTDPEDSALTYEWDFDGDGTFDATGVEASYTYDELGLYFARLRVTDAQGKFGLTSQQISVGNQAPVVTVNNPVNGGFFDWGNVVPMQVTTQDAEDGNETVCSRVSWTYGLGHDEHAHPELSGTGCQTGIRTDVNSPEHGAGALLYGAIVVTYRDGGHDGVPAAVGEATVRLNPKLQQAEHAIGRQGVVVFADEEASGGSAVRGLGSGDFLRYDPVNFSGIDSVDVRANGAGQVQLRWGAADAAPFAVAQIPAGAGWKDVSVALTGAPQGTGALFVTSADELAVDSLTMVGAGVADVQAPTVAHTLAPATPTGVGGVFNQPVRLSVQAVDNGALQSVQYSVNGGQSWSNLSANQQYGVTFNNDGVYNVLYRATDTAGNVSQVGEVSFTIDRSAPNEPTVDSVTQASVSSLRAVYGAPGEVAVTVSGEGGTPSGVVVVTSGTTEVGRATLSEGSATVELDRELAVGTHTLRVTYQADETFKVSSTTARLIVTKAATSVTADVASVKPAVAAKVNVHAETETGLAGDGEVTVQVKRGVSTVAMLSATLDENGDAVVTLPKLAAGTYSLTVAHKATANTTASSVITSLVVK